MIVFYAQNDFQSLNIGVRERDSVKMKSLCWNELTVFCPECIFGFYSGSLGVATFNEIGVLFFTLSVQMMFKDLTGLLLEFIMENLSTA